MTLERTIPVYLGGPCHGQPLPPFEQRLHVMLLLPPVERDYGQYPGGEGPELARYARRTYAVGGVSAHAWVHGDFAGGLRDTEAAEVLWTWLLDAAGVTS